MSNNVNCSLMTSLTNPSSFLDDLERDLASTRLTDHSPSLSSAALSTLVSSASSGASSLLAGVSSSSPSGDCSLDGLSGTRSPGTDNVVDVTISSKTQKVIGKKELKSQESDERADLDEGLGGSADEAIVSKPSRSLSLVLPSLSSSRSNTQRHHHTTHGRGRRLTDDDDGDDVMDMVAKGMVQMGDELRKAQEEEEKGGSYRQQVSETPPILGSTCCDLRWLHSSGASIAPIGSPRPDSPNQSVFLSHHPIGSFSRNTSQPSTSMPKPATSNPQNAQQSDHRHSPSQETVNPEKSSTQCNTVADKSEGVRWKKEVRGPLPPVNVEKIAAHIWSQPAAFERRLGGTVGPHGRIIRRSATRSISWSQSDITTADVTGNDSDLSLSTSDMEGDFSDEERRRRRKEAILFGKKRRRRATNSCCQTEAELVLTLMASAQSVGHFFPPVPPSAARSSDLEQQWKAEETQFKYEHPQWSRRHRMHTQSESSPLSVPPPDRSHRACSFLLKGRCRKEDCKFAHDLTQVTCRFWEAGECFKGLACPFLHGYPSSTPPTNVPTPSVDTSIKLDTARGKKKTKNKRDTAPRLNMMKNSSSFVLPHGMVHPSLLPSFSMATAFSMPSVLVSVASFDLPTEPTNTVTVFLNDIRTGPGRGRGRREKRISR